MAKKRILTGIRPTGRLHIGHLVGQIALTKSLQDEFDVFEMIADTQALTDNFHDPKKVHDHVLEVAIDVLAGGIDPEKSTIFVQSHIPAIPEMTVYFSNLVTIARLMRNPTVKTEIAQKKEVFGEGGVTFGFLGYPVSQAADITAFDADLVPAGDDQAPIIEQAREIVRKFNSIYGPTLKEPEHRMSAIPRLPGLDGNQKMGKSLGNGIFLADSLEEMSKKVMQGKTDPEKIHKDSPGNPDICTVFLYHSHFSGEAAPTIATECRKGERGCVQCKRELITHMDSFLAPLREKRDYFAARPDFVMDVLKEGTQKANAVANEVLERVRTNMHLRYFH
ncbi:tryptophan--tRNA ligase [Candidatus Gracilibacteria bacterium CG17_big_fil_post_rev_8_21_14_2_50_48_13]|nr:MAG: tryptophan--tRNA ligase [Candidatus Gracilibacteria bacterium CG17_big_fil_post_rev_8_21_14_2_50_48_13]